MLSHPVKENILMFWKFNIKTITLCDFSYEDLGDSNKVTFQEKQQTFKEEMQRINQKMKWKKIV